MNTSDLVQFNDPLVNTLDMKIAHMKQHCVFINHLVTSTRFFQKKNTMEVFICIINEKL